MTSLEIKTLRSSQNQVTPLLSQTQDPQEDCGNTQLNELEGKIDRELFVSWLFLIGSLMFVLDAILENLRGVSFSSLLHLSASILFTIGSVLFIPNNSQR